MESLHDTPNDLGIFTDTPYEGLKFLERQMRFATGEELDAVRSDLRGIMALLKALRAEKGITPDQISVVGEYLTASGELQTLVDRYVAVPSDENFELMRKKATHLANMRGHRQERKGYARRGHGNR